MKTTTDIPKIQPERIPKEAKDNGCLALREAITRAKKSPQFEQKFKEWKEQRNEKRS